MKAITSLPFAALLVFGIHSAGAAPNNFTIDPARSSISLAGNAAGFTFQEQGPGSLTTTFSGELAIDLTDSSAQITAGTMQAGVNGNWLPGANGQGAAAPANYGAQASFFLGTVTAALRNVVLNVTSPATPISNGSFDAGKIVFSFSETSLATLDYSAGLAGSGSKNLAGNATNKTATVATLTTVGVTNTLVIDIDATFFASLLTDNDSTLHILGKITAIKKSSGKEPPRFTDVEVVNHEIRFKVDGDITGFKLQSTADYQQWNDREPSVVIENNVPIYKLPASSSFEVFRFSS